MKSLVLAAAATLLAATAPALAKPKRGDWAIQRQTPATLAAKPTAADVEALLVDSTWRQPNPNKETSTWESHFYVFAKDGTLKRDGDLVLHTVTMKWKIIRAGAKPIVQIESAKLTLEPCVHGDNVATVCLFGKPPS